MTSGPVSDLDALLASMSPVLHAGAVVFAQVADGQSLGLREVIASVVEPEGVSVIVSEETAQARGLTPVFRAAWITLSVHSDLQAVGLTAAFARALAAAGISCNVVAGVCHDHLFVPFADAQTALAVLVRLQHEAAAGRGAA